MGDSVINGGVITEQDSLATSILSKNTPFQVLNISAGSWGPDNIAAYLHHYGTFKAQKMILVCSSHDSHDNMDFVPVVGKMSSYPSEQYSLAWIELIDRYLLPRIFGESEANQTIIKAGIEFNSGFDSLLKLSKSTNLISNLNRIQARLKSNNLLLPSLTSLVKCQTCQTSLDSQQTLLLVTTSHQLNLNLSQKSLTI